MTDIRSDANLVTQITCISVDPNRQDEVLALMRERAKFMAQQPGFVSIALHRSEDGSHIINYVQWVSRELLQAAHHTPEFRDKWSKLGDAAESAEPKLYDVVAVERMS